MRGGAIRGNVAVDGNDSEEFGGGIMILDINGRTGNCAPPNSVPRCNAVGSTLAKKALNRGS